MLARSIPQYDVMRDLVTALAVRHVQHESTVLDLGCSRGEALARVEQGLEARSTMAHFVGLEVAPPMVQAARERFVGHPFVEIREHDLRSGLPAGIDPSVVLSVLTLQFTPINYRSGLVRKVYEQLRKGGAFILVEKVLGGTAAANDTLVDEYHRLKVAHGYTPDEVQRKALALEGVLVPLTARQNEDLLAAEGFRSVECVWRYLSFAAWLAVKD
jgi:tRNA (cmo5U34)-methyltransferase